VASPGSRFASTFLSSAVRASISARKELVLACGISRYGFIKHLRAVFGQLDEDTATIVGVARPSDQATLFQAVEPARNACR
jgi:hypothetical protein